MTADPRKDGLIRRADLAERQARRSRLAGQHGTPESISASDALALAMTALVPVDPTATADDVYASVYRDQAAADAWLESNLTCNGHPTFAKVPLPDGRVVGILDLRPALRRAREESTTTPGEGDEACTDPGVS
jgi:hypothetical protein